MIMVTSTAGVRQNAGGGVLAVLYGIGSYALFFATFLYAIGFVGNLVVPKSVDTGAPGPLGIALLGNAALLGVFAVQHSVMARPAFKRWWTRFVPESVERSTYVLFSSLALILLYRYWQPIPTPVWTVESEAGRFVLDALFWLGFATVLTSTFLLNHFELFGLRQVFARLRRRSLPSAVFRTPLFYRYVRHPIYLGFAIAFWSTPQMTVGHLLFAIATTGYILIGILLEERDLIDLLGDPYRRYRQQVPMLLPLPGRKRASRADAISA
jgi:methanethiol S-methyltransferase